MGFVGVGHKAYGVSFGGIGAFAGLAQSLFVATGCPPVVDMDIARRFYYKNYYEKST